MMRFRRIEQICEAEEIDIVQRDDEGESPKQGEEAEAQPDSVPPHADASAAGTEADA